MVRFRNVVMLCTVVAFGLATFAMAQDKKPAAPGKPAAEKPAAQPSPEEMAMMQKAMEAAMPGEAHAKLKPMSGKWTYITKWRMSPEAPWGESTGKAEFKWVMGDRFLVQDIKGNPDPSMGGMSFEGHGMMGYDNVTKKYWSTWLDNMGTGVMVSEGTADGSGKTFTFSSEYSCPIKGTKVTTKSVTKIEGDDKLVFEMYDKAPDGKEFKNLEVTYTRVK